MEDYVNISVFSRNYSHAMLLGMIDAWDKVYTTYEFPLDPLKFNTMRSGIKITLQNWFNTKLIMKQ